MAVRRYRVTVGGRLFEVEVGATDGREVVVLDGDPLLADLLPANSAGVRRLRLGDHARELMLDASPDGFAIAIDGVTIDVRVEDERAARLARFGGTVNRATSHEQVTAPMPGLVVRVNVEVGRTVARGDSLVVLQAMKMENELGSPRDGRVRAVNVEAGQTVEQGQVLVELD